MTAVHATLCAVPPCTSNSNRKHNREGGPNKNIFSLFNDAVTSSDSVASNVGILTGKDLE
jgi:hypothetical protein